MNDKLPRGIWVQFRDVPIETSEQDIQNVIADRTGVIVELARISLQPSPLRTCQTGMVSFSADQVQRVMAWALSEDSLHGAPIVIKPKAA